MTIYTWKNLTGTFNQANDWVAGGASTPNTYIIPSGTCDISGLDLTLASTKIQLGSGYVANQTSPTLLMDYSTFEATTSLITQNAGITTHATIQANGCNYNYGSIDIVGQRTASNTTIININNSLIHAGYPVRFVDAGVINCEAYATLIVNGQTPTAQFWMNNGSKLLIGGTVDINANVVAGGLTMQFVAPASVTYNHVPYIPVLELDRGLNPGSTIDMTTDGTLKIGDVKDFLGNIQAFTGMSAPRAGYVAGTRDTIDLLNLNVTSVSYTNNGALALKIGNTVAGTLNFINGDYSASKFIISHSGSDTIITHT
jgi:hypothetical protein